MYTFVKTLLTFGAHMQKGNDTFLVCLLVTKVAATSFISMLKIHFVQVPNRLFLIINELIFKTTLWCGFRLRILAVWITSKAVIAFPGLS